MTAITLEAVSDILQRHTPVYRTRPPVYQTAMLADLAAVWSGHHANLLDIGGGTGVMAETMQALLPVGSVTAIDVVDRYFPTLSVSTGVYDGAVLPFEDGSFAAATINNVMHHVDVAVRGALMAEIRRVVSGPVYIKDHLARSPLDHARLAALDAIGNIPFGGQIRARYLTWREWEALAGAQGYSIAAQSSGQYRSGLMERAFPNRLEIAMRLDPA
ncbi:class I SAM-dependent methyltransferase [Erythrobacter sp. WG]|uniref:class I SAM-dependent methyltransferase n=1 Tax=Erythrobacter sp. WG TaxID=2985510 RepID=UPI00226EE829|nr:class I SAM-dependent methyltransferase [Erythrobacter sp. WG]MCX9148251.1 class I SAM-dependent methyltransferase [Erythrobacter sp. WG]